MAQYIIENRATVRSAAQKFGISKSTVHKDLSERLPTFNQPLYEQVKAVLEENKAERHIRGGGVQYRLVQKNHLMLRSLTGGNGLTGRTPQRRTAGQRRGRYPAH